ncbi:MAG: hypothetical protein HYT39_03715 [Candidatus Sungbacteria bacterium]|nr:hypothetical protein [Candidatus Sungbacteria bacterium]
MKKYTSEKLLDVLDSIRAKPEPARWAIVIGITSVVAVILLAFWVGKLGTTVQYVAENASAPNQELKSLLSPLEGVKESIQSLRAGKDIGEVAKNLEEITLPVSTNLAEKPSWFENGLKKAGTILDFNLALIGEVFMEMAGNVKKSF